MIDKQDDNNRDIRNLPKEKLVDLLRMTNEEVDSDTNDGESESSLDLDPPAEGEEN